MKFLQAILFATFLFMSGCAGSSSGGGVGMPGESSEPINSVEETQYRKALTRCYKTGGTRIVKINSYLHCY